VEGLEDGALVLRELGALAEGPGGPVKVPTWIFSSSRRISGQVWPAAFSTMRASRRASQRSR
jgi:hypothetical protein